MSIRRKHIQKLVKNLLDENGVKNPPVPISRIAISSGLLVRKRENPGSEISGFILRQGKRSLIGVNSSNSPVRQHFTIAHELGHYLLHSQKENHIHIDRQFEIRFRNTTSRDGSSDEEREANLFAAELLMPTKFILNEISEGTRVDFVDDSKVRSLAKKFKVSVQAMTFRLANLGVFDI